MFFQVFWYAVYVLIASIIGTLSGFGISTVMIPVFALFFPLPVTLLFVGVIHWFNDIWKLILFRQKGINKTILIWFGVTGVVASFLGAATAIRTESTFLLRFLGAFLIVYPLLLVWQPKFKVRASRLAAFSGGGLSGFFAGVFGVGGAIRGAFLTLYNLPKDVYLFTSGAVAFFIDITRLATYWTGGVRLPSFLAWGLLIMIPTSFLGAAIAKQIVDKIPQRKFRIVIAAFIFAFGVKLLLFP